MSSKSKKRLREGITTGASAAAAARAALLLLSGQLVSEVTIYSPAGQPITVPIAAQQRFAGGARAVVVKDGGDDPDITHGLEIVVEVRLSPGKEFKILGGRGVGRITRPGLQLPVGEAAINPVPRQMIRDAVQGVLPAGQGAIITVHVPGGERVACKTLNPRLGIEGGISILGTTGVVRPMSEEAFKNSLVPLVDMALAAGHRKLVLSPGNMGLRWATERFYISPETVIETSNFIGFMLDTCADRGIEKVILLGHHGKLVKVAAGIFHTHSKMADARMEILTAHAAMAGAGSDIAVKIMNCRTVEEALGIIKDNGLLYIYDHIAARASARAAGYTRGQLQVGTVLMSYDGNILGIDDGARSIGREMGWKL